MRKPGIFLAVWLAVFAVGQSRGTSACFAQEEDLSVAVDVSMPATPMPDLFQPSVDMSGRGGNKDTAWPQAMASWDAVEQWQKVPAGKGALSRVQYNLWELDQAMKDPKRYEALKANYEKAISSANRNGGAVIVSLFGMPANMGKVKDKKSPPADMRDFKGLVKATIRELSCEKKFPIWYEVWTAPDLDDFFIGRKQEYLAMYKAAAEAVKELEAETGTHIPIGGPGSSWWFQNMDGNSISVPERSLMYELIRFCAHYRLPLDFISWHSYSSDPRAEQATTIYRKSEISLIRDWLSYFSFDKKLPLVIDEWNYDCADNVTPARAKDSYIAASYIPARLARMQESGIDRQVFYCLEDFQGNSDNVVRNVGVFGFSEEGARNKEAPKAAYAVFTMLGRMGSGQLAFSPKLNDEFVSVIAGKDQDTVTVLVANYIDPEISYNYLTRMIGMLSEGERRQVLSAVSSKRMEKLLNGELSVKKIPGTPRVKGLLSKAQELNAAALSAKVTPRHLKLALKNLKGIYEYNRYVVDSRTADMELSPAESSSIPENTPWQEDLTLAPYSVQFLVFKKVVLPPPLPPEQTLPVVPPVVQGNNGIVVNQTAPAPVEAQVPDTKSNQTGAAKE